GLRGLIAQMIEDVRSGSHADARDLCRLHLVLPQQLQHRVHRRMPERAARVRLDRDAGVDDRERFAERWDDTWHISATTQHLEEYPGAVERFVAGSKSA